MFRLILVLMLLAIGGCTHMKKGVILPPSEVAPSHYFLAEDSQRVGVNFDGDKEEFDKLLEAKRLGIRFIRLIPSKWQSKEKDSSFLIGKVDDYRGLVSEDVERLIRFLNWADRLGIRVVLAFDTIPGLKEGPQEKTVHDGFFSTIKTQEKALEFFYDIALRIGNHPAVLALNPLSAPSPEGSGLSFTEVLHGDYLGWYEKIRGSAQDLNQFNKAVVKNIRRARAKLPIVLDSGLHAHPLGFKILEPINDNDIYYAFRFIAPAANGVGSDDAQNHPDKEKIREILAPVLAWQREYSIDGSRIMVSEFGVGSNMPSSNEFIRDCNELFRELGYLRAFSNFNELEAHDHSSNDQKNAILDALDLKRTVFLKPMKGFLTKHDSNEDEIKTLLHEIKDSGLFQQGFDAIIASTGWQEEQLSKDGMLVANPKKFPQGIKAVSENVEQHGFKFGLEIPMGTTDSSGHYQGTLGHEQKNALLVKDLGSEILLLTGGYLDDSEEWDRELLYATLYEWNKQLSGKNIITIADTNAHQFWFNDLVNVSRTARSLRPTALGGPHFASEFLGGFDTIVMAARINSLNFLLASDHYLNYPGFLFLGSGLNPEEEKSYIAMWAIMGSPLLLTKSPTELPKEALGILKNNNLLRVQSDQFEPGRLIVDEGKIFIFRKHLSDGAKAYLFVNLDREKEFVRKFSHTELNVPKEASITHGISDKASKFTEGTIQISLKPHDCELLIIE